MKAALADQLTRNAFMHHADPLEVDNPGKVGMMHEYSPGELLNRATFMHHTHKGHIILKHCAALGGLTKDPYF